MQTTGRKGVEILRDYLKGMESVLQGADDRIKAIEEVKRSPDYLQLELLIDIRTALDSVRNELETLRKQLK